MTYPTYPSVINDYALIKSENLDAIVFFRMGDFYETFHEDARIVSRELDLVLLARKDADGNDVCMAGVPYHAVESYVVRLLEKGIGVVMCEPAEKE